MISKSPSRLGLNVESCEIDVNNLVGSAYLWMLASWSEWAPRKLLCIKSLSDSNYWRYLHKQKQEKEELIWVIV